MDRMRHGTIKLASLAVILAGFQAYAGTQLAPPYQAVEPDQPGDNFPESRFGYAPAKLDIGTPPNYAAKAAKEIDEGTDDSESHGIALRRPASSEFSAQPGMAPAVTQAGTMEGMRTSQAAPIDTKELAPLRKGVQEVALIASDLGFFPKTFFVSRDVPVRLFVTGASKNTLCIMMDSFQVRKQVRSQKIEEITFTPNVPGQYRFYCPVNGMEGAMVVRELTSASTGIADSESGAENENSSRNPASTRNPASSRNPAVK